MERSAKQSLLTTPNATYVKRKISVSDDINIEIADVVKAFINPPNAPNTSQPEFAYNELTNPAITGRGILASNNRRYKYIRS
jgi:hypothetical protein